MNKEKENNQKYSEDNRPIIFFNNNETLMKEKNENQSIKNSNNDVNNQNIIYYLATSIFLLCMGYKYCFYRDIRFRITVDTSFNHCFIIMYFTRLFKSILFNILHH